MRVTLRTVVAVTVVLLVAAVVAAGAPLPENPHAGLSDEADCLECHESCEGGTCSHTFVVYVPEECWSCHSTEYLGRSHPIDVDPSRSREEIEVPGELPLEESKVSCGTCHNPHAEWLSVRKSYKKQKPEVTVRDGGSKTHYYKTYYLRLSDPELGYEVLCRACHQNY